MRVASDVDALCGRCGETRHIVIALAAGRAAEVECQQCGARHRYRPPRGAPRPPRAAAAARSPATPRARKPARPVVAADPSRPPRPFRTTDTYRVGDRVLHASFGEGVVQAITGPAKVEVLFEAGPKTLVHARA
jgi:hypothetical protein